MRHKNLNGSSLHVAKTSTGLTSPVGVQTPTVIGQIYTDTSNNTLWVATGLTNTSWIAISGGLVVSTSAPSNPILNSLWVDIS